MPLNLQSLLGFSNQLVLFLKLLNCSLLLALGLINYGARLGPFLHLSLANKMSASKLIFYFSSHPAAFGFQSSTPPDNIILTPANRKANQNLSDFQTATLDMEQLISHFRVALVDTISPLPNSEGGVISVSEVCELLIKVHDILDNAVSKWVGNFTHILVHVFNSASGQYCEVWASQFPFLHGLKDVVPPSEPCLYGHINWSLAQAQQQSSIGLSQSLPPKRGGKTRPLTGFHFNVQKRPLLESNGSCLAKRPHLESETETHPGGKKSAGVSVSANSADTRKKGSCGGWCSWCVTVHSLLTALIFGFAGWYAFPFFEAMEMYYFEKVCA